VAKKVKINIEAVGINRNEAIHMVDHMSAHLEFHKDKETYILAKTYGIVTCIVSEMDEIEEDNNKPTKVFEHLV